MNYLSAINKLNANYSLLWSVRAQKHACACDIRQNHFGYWSKLSYIYVHISIFASKYLLVPSYSNNFSNRQRIRNVFVGYEAKFLFYKGE